MAFEGPIAGSTVRAAIYADSGGGSPSTLIVQSAFLSNTLAQGWNIVPIPVTVLPAGIYWLGAFVGVGGTLYNFTGSPGTGLAATGDWSTGAPDPFTGG